MDNMTAIYKHLADLKFEGSLKSSSTEQLNAIFISNVVTLASSKYDAIVLDMTINVYIVHPQLM